MHGQSTDGSLPYELAKTPASYRSLLDDSNCTRALSKALLCLCNCSWGASSRPTQVQNLNEKNIVDSERHGISMLCQEGMLLE